MKIPFVYHASYSQLALPANHRFPTSKYQNLYEHALQHQLVCPTMQHQADAIKVNELKQIHHADYVDAFINGTIDGKAIRRIGFPWSEQLVTRTLHAINGTKLTCELALAHQIAVHFTGGYHHAHHDFGSGFCIFNDLVIAADHLLKQGKLDKVLIFDCDVHQGDGTATLTTHRQDIISCSVHCKQNFPFRKAASHYDIELDKGCNDEEYLGYIETIFNYLVQLHKPDLVIYDAGVDVHQDDDLGYFELTTQGILARDKLILSIAKHQQIPIAAVIGGGYSKQAALLTERHSQLLIAAKQIWV
ncbi:histone deacetylase family protein [Shewanella aestuarii]|uniref:Histone deacetylase n=1 Tax=Shewanella aestuarii TaxID=1028752 RepID=A0A6G9QJS7_9GAMM|nr:histone deacetylase [Shewanella aestuarii]QIR14129.1 histone deacetylase [Shewanella aestuarii]